LNKAVAPWRLPEEGVRNVEVGRLRRESLLGQVNQFRDEINAVRRDREPALGAPATQAAGR